MRLKKVKGASLIINKSPYIVLNPKEYCGHYQDLFENIAPLHIEIGTGKGDFIIEMAKQNPHINFIGIEKYDSVMIRAVQKLNDINLSNLKLILMDALEIDQVFNQEIDVIYLNFSDPWPKKRHINRRLTSPVFLEKYNHLFKSNHHIIMKTDNRLLFEYSLMTLIDNNYKIKDLTLDLYNSNIENNVPTEYERKFVLKGNVIYRGYFIK